jgi:hypothetical protein
LLSPLSRCRCFSRSSTRGRWRRAPLSRNDTADTIHHEWILAWDAHALATDPLHLFDANIFYPEKDTLAYSDHLIVQGVMGAPLFWLGGSPVLVYNVLLIAGLTLTCWTTMLVVERWTGNAIAAALSGSLVAFNAMTLTRFPEIQDQHLEFFPLALWALDRLLLTPGFRYAAHLAVWFALQALTCGYLLVFVTLSMASAAAARASEWLHPKAWRHAVGWLVAAGAMAGIVMLPFLLPYLRVSRAQGFTRSFEEVAQFSARFSDYLSTGARLHYTWWSQPFFRSDALFPGVLGLLLTLVAVVTGIAWKDRRARMALAFGLVAFAVSFGPAFPLYRPLTWVFPIMAGLRGAVRSGQLVLVAVGILAGFAWVTIQQRRTRPMTLVGMLLIVGVNLEALRAPIEYRAFAGIPPIFDTLRTPERHLVACFPFPGPLEISKNVDCMLASTRFWQPLVNGYSSFNPDSYARSARALDAFPEGDTLQYLRGLGVTRVVVFTDKLSAPRVAHLPEHPELSLLQDDGSVRIYELK